MTDLRLCKKMVLGQNQVTDRNCLQWVRIHPMTYEMTSCLEEQLTSRNVCSSPDFRPNAQRIDQFCHRKTKVVCGVQPTSQMPEVVKLGRVCSGELAFMWDHFQGPGIIDLEVKDQKMPITNPLRCISQIV